MLKTGFSRPTVADLKNRIKADFLTRLQHDEVLRRSDLDVQATIQAATLNSLYTYIEWTARQILPDTADSDHLDRHGSLWGIRRKPATTAQGIVRVSGSGAVLAQGAELVHNSGRSVVVRENTVLTAPQTEVPIAATEVGSLGNLPSGELLSLVSPVEGVSSTAVIAHLTGGTDPENDDAYRARILDRIQQPPHGGASFDYETWALTLPGVTRVWVLPLYFGVGTVGVTFVMDDRDRIIPESSDVERVQTHIDAVRPVTADVIVFAPKPMPLDITITVQPSRGDIQSAITEEITDFLRREAVPGGVVYVSRLREAISLAAGEFSHTLISPADNITSERGHIAVLGTVQWTA